jgi:hypothetical protein
LIDDKIFFERRNFIIHKTIQDAKFNKFSNLFPYETGWNKVKNSVKMTILIWFKLIEVCGHVNALPIFFKD